MSQGKREKKDKNKGWLEKNGGSRMVSWKLGKVRGTTIICRSFIWHPRRGEAAAEEKPLD